MGRVGATHGEGRSLRPVFYVAHELIHRSLETLKPAGFLPHFDHGLREGPQDDAGLGVQDGQSELVKLA